jgi:DNA-binding NarL/FixJ family response regulator
VPGSPNTQTSHSPLAAVLVVEDDQRQARSIGFLLERRWPVVIHGTKAAAVQFVESGATLTALIVDIGLPDGSGLDVASRARELAPGLPMLVVTGSRHDEHLNHAQFLRAELALKPGHMPGLRTFVRRLVLAECVADENLRWRVEVFAGKHGFTARETEIVALASLGTGRAKIEDHCGISENTLKTHVKTLLLKCGASSLGEISEWIRPRDEN